MGSKDLKKKTSFKLGGSDLGFRSWIFGMIRIERLSF